MVAKVLIKRTSTANSPPVTLDPGELAVEMDTPLRLWVGVPTNLDTTGKKLLVPLGGVVVSETPPVLPAPNTLWWESDTGVLWLWYDDGTSQQWVQAAGSGASPDDWVNVTGDTMTGYLTINSANPVIILDKTTPNVSGGIVSKMNGVFRWSVNISDPQPENGGNTGSNLSFTPYDDNGVIIGTGPVVEIKRSNGTLTVRPPVGTGSSYAIDARGFGAPPYGSGIVAWAAGLTFYGMAGAYVSGGQYSFYGNVGAFLSAGAWSTSDAAIKNVSGELDRVSALAAVNSIAVKEFTPISEHAGMMLYGANIPGTLFGWIAQEVEPILPLAVRNVGVPDVDLSGRATIKGVPIPEKDTPAAASLAAEDITVKAINDRYMIATLWAAVQQLSAEVEALKAGA